ncbi:hypothetical protein NDU88_002612 [Pleurodeles waltl]|uniref:Uncharacterized protein n=1 Tax=Pleurodeles waltl TaxID=8319 RepID=A0AAV7VEX4_PLEWA|nr:hypothetical protein NDU88_002612 [Pleurodeles waltl]
MIPDLGEDIIIGTDYDAFAYLLNNANQEHTANLWWKEAPFVTSEIEEHSISKKLSKKQKCKQKQGYRRKDDDTQLSVPTDPKPIMTVAGSFRQVQREDPTLKNAWHSALAPDGARTHLIQHHICTIGDKIARQRPYRIPEAKRQADVLVGPVVPLGRRCYADSLGEGTNPLLLPGDGGQQQLLYATARFEMAEGGDSEERCEYEEEEKKKETGQITAAM